MALLFNESPKYLLTSESVTEGHPDKLCDQISDAVLDAVLSGDPMGRVACETCVTNGLVVVMGEITTSCYVDVPGIVRETLHNVGYVKAEYGIDAKSCGVSISIQEQSADISAGVSRALEVRDRRGQRTPGAEIAGLAGAGNPGNRRRFGRLGLCLGGRHTQAGDVISWFPGNQPVGKTPDRVSKRGAAGLGPRPRSRRGCRPGPGGRPGVPSR